MTILTNLALLWIGAGIGVFIGAVMTSAKVSDLQAEVDFLTFENEQLRSGEALQ